MIREGAALFAAFYGATRPLPEHVALPKALVAEIETQIDALSPRYSA